MGRDNWGLDIQSACGVAGITETWWESLCDRRAATDGYKLFSRDWQGR